MLKKSFLSVVIFAGFFCLNVTHVLAGPSCMLEGGGIGSCTDSSSEQCPDGTGAATPLTTCPNQGSCCVAQSILESQEPATPTDTSNGLSQSSCTATDGRGGFCTQPEDSIVCPNGQELALADIDCHCCVPKKETSGTNCTSNGGSCVTNSTSGGSACSIGTSPISVSPYNDCGSFSTCCMTPEQQNKLLPPAQNPDTTTDPVQKCINEVCLASGQVTSENADIEACKKNCQNQYANNTIPSNPDINGKDAPGLVPCGNGDSPADACTLCDFIVGFYKIIEWGKNILVALTLTGVFISGVLYIISSGSALVDKAKKLLTSSLIGFTIVLTAWLIVNVVFWVFSFDSQLIVNKPNWWTFDVSCPRGSAGITSTNPAANTPAGATLNN